MMAKKTSPLLLAGVTVLLSCLSIVVVLEIDHAIAWIASSSWKHNHNRVIRSFDPSHLQKTRTSLVNFGATRRDGDLSEDIEPSPLANDGADNSARYHSSPHQGPRQDLPPLKATDLEETLLSQHNALESYIYETETSTAYRPPEIQNIEPSIPQAIGKVKSVDENKGDDNDAAAAAASERSTPFFLDDATASTRSTPFFLDDATASTRSTPYFLRPVPYFLHSQGNRNKNVRNKKRKEVSDECLKDSDEREQIVAKKETSLQPGEGAPIDRPKQETSLAHVEGASIDQAIFDFNKNLVNVIYAIISLLYPSSQEQTDPKTARVNSYLSPLLGTEYNEELEPEMILKFQKFYVFETVARIPYFAYLSVLHLRESLGDRGSFQDTENNDFSKKYVEAEERKYQNKKRIETMRTHYAQADNELHHLLIMEALGGNSRSVDRLLAHTMAFFYYWFVVLVFFWKEQAAYHLNEVIEDHAYKIYDEFLTLHEAELRGLPVPDIARKYYENDFHKNPHLFEAFCAVSKSTEKKFPSKNGESDRRKNNRPHELNSLYDVFRNIRDDEKEHWMALCNLVQYDDIFAVEESNVKSTKGRELH